MVFHPCAQHVHRRASPVRTRPIQEVRPSDGLQSINGKLFVNIFEARGLRPSFDPYVLCVFEWNEYISKGARDGEEEKKRRQMDADAEAGRPMSIPMRNRQIPLRTNFRTGSRTNI